MNKKELVIDIDSEVSEWFDEVEKNIQNESNKFKIKANLRLLNHNDYVDEADFTVPFGEEYFPKGVYVALSKSNDEDERNLVKEFWRWSPFFAFDKLLSRYEQLEEVIFETGYSWRRNKFSIKKRKGDEHWLNLNKFSCSCDSVQESKENIPFFMKDIATLTEYQLPDLKDQTLTETIVKNNPNLETFACSWDFVSKEVLSRPYKNFLVDKKYAKKYAKLNENLKEIDDEEKYILFRLFLLEHTPTFKPKIETLLGFLKCGLAPVRIQALKLFHTHYSNPKIESIDGLNICISGTLQSYKSSQAKEELSNKNVKISTKVTDKTELLVVGLKPKLEELPLDIPVISAIAFEEFLSNSENRILAENSNENIIEKVQNLLFSDDDNNVMLAMTLMEEGGIPQNVFEVLAGFFKVHPNKKIRDKAKELIVRHGGEKGEAFLSICAKRNYISMGDDTKPKKDLLALEMLEGFDVELFAYILVVKKDIAKFYLVTKESVWAKKAIIEKINKTRSWLKINGKASSHFKLATNIDTIYTNSYSNVFEEMTWLKKLYIENKKETINLSKEALLNLKHLDNLKIEAKHIKIEGSLCVNTIELKASTITVLGKLEAKNKLEIETKELEIISLESSNEIILKMINQISDNIEFLGNPTKLLIYNCDFSQDIYRKIFMESLEVIEIEVKKKFTLDDAAKNLNLEFMSIEAKSIVIEGEQALLLSDKVTLKTQKLLCKKNWEHKIKSLEVVYGDFLEKLVNESIQKLIIRYDFCYDYYSGTSMEFLIPSFLAQYPNIECLELEHYEESEKAISFESYVPLSIKKLHLKDLRLELKEKLPTPKLETLMLDEVILNEKTKEYLMLPSIQKITYSEYKGKFSFNTSKLNNLYELDLYLDEVKDKIYLIKKLTINHSQIEIFKPKNFPNVEILNQRCIESESLSGLIGFKKLKRLETMTCKYTNSNLIDIEKLEGLEELKLYKDYISYGEHEVFYLPLFKKPLKIKKLELEKLNINITDSQHQYFTNLEELVLNDALVSDFSIFNIPSLKRVRVINKPSVNCPKNWIEELKEIFNMAEIIV